MSQEDFWKKLYDNKSTSDFQKSAARSGRMSYKEMASILDKYLKFNKQDSVADIGGANAGLAIEISTLVSGVVMIDYSSGQIENAKTNTEKAKIKNLTCILDSYPDLSQLPTSAFSKVYSGACIQYLDKSKINVAMKNLHRILVSNGQAILFHCHSQKLKKRTPHGRFNDLISFYTFEELQLAATSAGFQSCEKIRFEMKKDSSRWESCVTVDNPDLSLSILLKKGSQNE